MSSLKVSDPSLPPSRIGCLAELLPPCTIHLNVQSFLTLSNQQQQWVHWAYATYMNGSPPVKYRDYRLWVTIHQYYADMEAQDNPQEDLIDTLPEPAPPVLQCQAVEYIVPLSIMPIQ